MEARKLYNNDVGPDYAARISQLLKLLGGIQVSLPDRRELGQVSLRQAVGTFRDEISQSAALQLHSVNRAVAMDALQAR